jgi:hypothetical protein
MNYSAIQWFRSQTKKIEYNQQIHDEIDKLNTQTSNGGKSKTMTLEASRMRRQWWWAAMGESI